MNERQREYFRQKLLAWKEEILKEAKETLAHLQGSRSGGVSRMTGMPGSKGLSRTRLAKSRASCAGWRCASVCA